MITSIDEIDEWRLFGYESNQGVEPNELEAEPIVEEQGGDIELSSIYISRVFRDEEKA